MKLVTAVIKPFRLTAVVDAARAAGATGVTVSEAKGFGRQGGHTEVYRGSEYTIELVPKLTVEVVVADAVADAVVDAMLEAARTGKIGDGKVWIRSVDLLRRIRTAEVGTEAL